MKRGGFFQPAGRMASLSLLLVLTGLACVKRPVDYEREVAQKLAPKKLETTPASAAGPVRTLRVRVYADSDYREQVPRWRSAIVEQLRRASDVVRGPLGVTFELETTNVWERRGVEDTLESTLAELEVQDPGDDVDLVVGFVSALKYFSATQHQLGMARMFGRHFVMRDMQNAEEVRELMSVLTHLPEKEREALYEERRRHKETSVFVHEWAHTLGAFHVTNTRWMMSAQYESHQSAFDPRTLELLQVSLRHLPQGRRDVEVQRAWARELKEKLTASPWPDGEGPERNELLAILDKVLAGEQALVARPGMQLPPEDRQRLEEVLASEKRGELEKAARQLEPLAGRYPDNEHLQVLVCSLASRTAPKAASTRERCEAAAARFPEAPAPLVYVALMEFEEGRPLEAQALLLKVRQRLESRSEVDPDLWADLANLFRRAGSVTWAEQAAAKAPKVERSTEALTWATQTRRWVALPADPHKSGVPVEREGELIRAAREVETQLDKGSVAKARERLAGVAREFPRAPTVQVLQCEVHLRSGQVAPARAACRKALATHDESVKAHFILGWMATRTRSGKEARMHLERVVALAPLHEDAWKLLAVQYRGAAMHDALKDLQERYQQQFSRELR